MRDFVVVVLVFGSVPLTLLRPQVGIIMWFWLSLMNPHRLAWGYAQDLRVALVVGLATVAGWLWSKDPKRPPNSVLVYALAALTLWVSVAAFFAIHPEVAIPKWEQIIKILAMNFVTMCIVQSRERIDQLVWVCVVSIGYYAIKGGVFSILTGGTYQVWGPPDSFIGDNNSLATAEIMIVPLLQYLRMTTTNRWIRLALLCSIGLSIVSILGSYSRGALLGLCTTLLPLWLKSKHRLITGAATIGVLLVALAFMPEKWFDRMNTIETYQVDASALGRLDAWTFAFKLAMDRPLTGGGQLIGEDSALFMRYVPTADSARAAHSIYFEVLGETGFVGLAIFLFLLIASFVVAGRIVRVTRQREDLAWARNLGAMCQASIAGYASAGAFLSLGFYDLYYVLVAIVGVTQLVVKRELAKPVGGVVKSGAVAGEPVLSPAAFPGLLPQPGAQFLPTVPAARRSIRPT